MTYLRSSISDNNSDSGDLSDWSSSTSLTECLISDMLNGGSGSSQSSQILDISDGILQRFSVGIVVQSEFMSDLIRLLHYGNTCLLWSNIEELGEFSQESQHFSLEDV